jgi:hypothetical protein
MAEEQGRRRKEKWKEEEVGKEEEIGEKKKWKGEEEISVNPLQNDVFFLGAFFGLYVRCQFISGCKKHHLFAMTELKLFSSCNINFKAYQLAI